MSKVTSATLQDKELQEKFWSRVTFHLLPSLCWEWNGAIDSKGYGSFAPSYGEAYIASRFAFQVWNNRVLNSSIIVRHKCDNRKCVNPSHLEEGTAHDNSMDMCVRGRSRLRFSASQVKEIKDKLDSGYFTQHQLATMYNTSQSTIKNINCGYYKTY